ncbi:hypothetical protein LTR65_002685 [Meristemomyces frigidus]
MHPTSSSIAGPKTPSTEQTPEAASKIVEEANSLSHKAFYDRYISGPNVWYGSLKHDVAYSLEDESAAPPRPIDLTLCFNLIEETSRGDYEASSKGWHPRSKRREMRDPAMRYLLVGMDHRIFAAVPLEGFMSFMITHDSTPSVPVLYIYEIHLAGPHRGKGLGKHLMCLAEEIARRVGVEKVMLTCFVSNSEARQFYERLGYAVDECSPADRKTRKKTVKADYVIMSKRVKNAQTSNSTLERAVPSEVTAPVSSVVAGNPNAATTEPAIPTNTSVLPLAQRLRAKLDSLSEARELLKTCQLRLLEQPDLFGGPAEVVLHTVELAAMQVQAFEEEVRKSEQAEAQSGAYDGYSGEEDDLWEDSEDNDDGCGAEDDDGSGE